MNEEPWAKHTPGYPMPCKCGDSVVEVIFADGATDTDGAKYWEWGKIESLPTAEITVWRFVERKGEDIIHRCAECDCEGGESNCNWLKWAPIDPYDALEWDEDDTAIVKLEKPGQPWWVRDDDLVRFDRTAVFEPVTSHSALWWGELAFQIKRRPVLTPAEPQLLAVLSVATEDEADAIRSAARRANIEVPE